jgi:hypothetical protein
MHCPRCDQRKTKLYFLGESLHPVACRACHRLHYESQSLGLCDRWRRQAESLYRRAGCHIDDSFYRKPKQMHWETFNRLIDRAQEYEDAFLELELSRLTARFRARFPNVDLD